MRVPARLYASEAALDGILEDQSLNQLMNVSTLPGITKAAIAMPDAHQGMASLSAVLRPPSTRMALFHPAVSVTLSTAGYDCYLLM